MPGKSLSLTYTLSRPSTTTGLRMSGREKIAEQLGEQHSDRVIFFDPPELDEALIDIAVRIGLSVPAYDYDKLIAVHQRINNWSYEDAEEWVHHHTMGGYVGPETPVVVWRPH